MTGEQVIVGAGIAGLSLAWALLERGQPPEKLTVVDGGSNRVGSAAPVAMLHPFPGRSMGLRRGQGEAFEESWKRLKTWSEELGGDWWRPAPMVRLLDDEQGERLRQSWEKGREEYPALIRVRQLSAREVAREFAGLEPKQAALVYEPAAGVALDELIARLRKALESGGVRFVDRAVLGLERDAGCWRVRIAGGDAVTCEQVVLAIGTGLEQVFPGLDMRRKAGELVVLDPGGAKLEVLINGSGHVFERPDGLWGLGSTYFPVGEWPQRSDEAAAEELVGRLVGILPALEEARVCSVWRGVRSIFGSDHMPLVGAVPAHDGLFVLGAFGSKGLLWAPLAARQLAERMLGEDGELAPAIDLGRVSARGLKGVQISTLILDGERV